MSFSVQKIGVLGAGQMGSGIAQTAAHHGFQIFLSDQKIDLAIQAKSKIFAQTKKLIDKGKMTDNEQKHLLDNIVPVGGIDDFSQCQLVIEAVTEKPDLKFKIFRELCQKVEPHTLLASNTSSISITAIAAQTLHPENVVGMHFMNPVPIMKLVEGIRGLQTSPQTMTTVKAVAEKMGKVWIETKDMPGFAVNRILMPMINEAITALHEGIASVADLDQAMKLGTNQPMGPLTLADFIGLDTCLAILEVMHQGLGDPKYRPCPLLRNYVTAGWLGKKTGRGFYHYDV